MKGYRYTECGLDNVFIEGIKPVVDDDKQETITIPNVRGLHRAIAETILHHENSISGKELRFLRTEMGMTQGELAKHVHRDAQTVGRWERGEIELDVTAEVIIRLLAEEELGLETNLSVAETTARCVPTAEVQPIDIDGSDPKNYRAKKLAA